MAPKAAAKAAKPPPAHPKYIDMIRAALLALKERTGSSAVAIAKFMETEYKGKLPANFKKTLSVQLKNLVASKKLVKVKASYKLSDALKKEPKAAKPKAAKPKAAKPKAAKSADDKPKAPAKKAPAKKAPVKKSAAPKAPKATTKATTKAAPKKAAPKKKAAGKPAPKKAKKAAAKPAAKKAKPAAPAAATAE